MPDLVDGGGWTSAGRADPMETADQSFLVSLLSPNSCGLCPQGAT